MIKGFVKVSQDFSGTIRTVTVWNPITSEVLHVNCEDTEYGIDGFDMGRVSCRFSADERRHLLFDELLFDGDPLIESGWKAFKEELDYARGIVCEGMRVRVAKGRNVKVGTEGTVERIRPWKDRYGRTQVYYCDLDSGISVRLENVVPIQRA